MPTAATTTANLRYGRMIKPEKETARDSNQENRSRVPNEGVHLTREKEDRTVAAWI
jgi:hypothetical protein